MFRKSILNSSCRIKNARPFPVNYQEHILPKKSVFNKIVGDSHFELQLANFLDECDDIISYAKNYFSINYKLDYVNYDKNISHYYPDFIVKKSEKEVFIIETKGVSDFDVPLKMERLKKWCEDVNKLQNEVKFDFIFVDQVNYERYEPKKFQDLITNFLEYKD